MKPVGRPPAPRVLVACKVCGAGVEKTEKEAARVKSAICGSCRAARQSVPWQCRACGVERTLPASVASHISRCEDCRPTALKPMRDFAGICEQCGESFSRRVAAGQMPRFCGGPCRVAWFAGAFTGEASPHWLGGDSLPYGVHWKAVRRLVYLRDGDKCRACNASRADGATLVAAHLMPRRSFETAALSPRVADHPANLVALCVPCHMQFDRAEQTRWDYATGTRAFWPDWTAQRVADKLAWAREMVALYGPSGEQAGIA